MIAGFSPSDRTAASRQEQPETSPHVWAFVVLVIAHIFPDRQPVKSRCVSGSDSLTGSEHVGAQTGGRFPARSLLLFRNNGRLNGLDAKIQPGNGFRKCSLPSCSCRSILHILNS